MNHKQLVINEIKARNKKYLLIKSIESFDWKMYLLLTNDIRITLFI